MAHKRRKPDIEDVAGITIKLKSETKVEHIYLIKNGKALAWFQGSKDSVTISKDEMLRFGDGLVLHNHPNGTSFSLHDIQETIRYNVREIRLFTLHNTFILKRPRKGWGISFQDQEVARSYNEICQSVDELLEQLYSNGKMTLREIEAIVNHLVWERFFNKFGIDYNMY